MNTHEPSSQPPARWLITGAGGMLGREIQSVLSGADVLALTRRDLDVADAMAVLRVVRSYHPDVVVNAAAFTSVDLAETNEPAAFSVNALGAANVAAACADTGVRLVHVSTDYVFDGCASTPYAENDALAPVSAYGRTKAAGEWAVQATLPDATWIVRTAWLYGTGGKNFVETILDLESRVEHLDVVDDRRGQPTWAADVARQIVRMVTASAPVGTYHATSSGATTWWGFARAIFALIGADTSRVRPVTSARFPRAARRPANSELGHDAWAHAGLPALPHWRESLEAALPQLQASR